MFSPAATVQDFSKINRHDKHHKTEKDLGAEINFYLMSTLTDSDKQLLESSVSYEVSAKTSLTLVNYGWSSVYWSLIQIPWQLEFESMVHCVPPLGFNLCNMQAPHYW